VAACSNGDDLPRQCLVGSQDVQPQPGGEKPDDGLSRVRHGVARRPDGADLLDKLRVLGLVRRNVVRVDSHPPHQRLLIGKVVFGIGHQTRKRVVQQDLAIVQIGALEGVAQFIEQINQRVVLDVHVLDACDEVLVPDKGIHGRCP
jgi:hypothetical protein